MKGEDAERADVCSLLLGHAINSRMTVINLLDGALSYDLFNRPLVGLFFVRERCVKAL